jgi:predicted peptidase
LNSQSFKIHLLILFLTFGLLQGCDNGSTSGPEPLPPIAPYWEIATPDFSNDDDRPVVDIVGDKVVLLSVGETFVDPGSVASDRQDGDISSNIVVDSQVDIDTAGDYLVRYQATDSSQKSAIDAVRIVRVVDQVPVDLSPRPFGSTQSHLGYVEHLPHDYGLDETKQYPLLIYNHGNAANAEFGGNNPLGALGLLISNAGPGLLLNGGKWDADLPFIVLIPQVGNVVNFDMAARMNAFVDYALNTYAVDESQIYMTGWSQGGFLSFLYAIEHSDRVAAIISVSGGIPIDTEALPDNFCDIQNVPIWAFHGDADDIVSVQSSIESITLIEERCQPQILPRLTIFEGKDHVIHHSVFNLTSMLGGSLGNTTDPQYDAYDQSIFDWLLSHSNNQ